MDEKAKENSTLPPEESLPGDIEDNTREGGEGKVPQVRKRGRPPGAKNKDTLFKELMQGKFQETAETEIAKTIQVLFKEANEGNMQAIKMIMDRVVPVSKAVDLSDMEKRGLQIQINVGNLEESISVQAVEEGEFEEMEDA